MATRADVSACIDAEGQAHDQVCASVIDLECQI
jgi:hypothetical protein